MLKKGLSYELALEVMGREAVQSFVGLGPGVSILSEYYLSKENRRSPIIKDVSEHFGHGEPRLVARKGRHLNQAAMHFIDLVRKEVKRAGLATSR